MEEIYCNYSTEEIAKDFVEDVSKVEELLDNFVNSPKTKDVLVIKVKSGINIKADLMDHWRKEILRQKETGVVVLPWFLEAEIVPEDVEVQVIDSRSNGFFGDDRDSLIQEQIENLQ